MAQPYYVRKTELKVGERAGETVYNASAYYYGTISTSSVAKQIAQESALTQADVIGVLDRLAYFCQTHMALGYKIKLDGIGTLRNTFVTSKSVSSAEEVSAKNIESIKPGFKPEYSIVNGSFRYSLLPEKTELVKITFANGTTAVDDDSEQVEGEDTDTKTDTDTGSGSEGESDF